MPAHTHCTCPTHAALAVPRACCRWDCAHLAQPPTRPCNLPYPDTSPPIYPTHTFKPYLFPHPPPPLHGACRRADGAAPRATPPPPTTTTRCHTGLPVFPPPIPPFATVAEPSRTWTLALCWLPLWLPCSLNTTTTASVIYHSPGVVCAFYVAIPAHYSKLPILVTFL